MNDRPTLMPLTALARRLNVAPEWLRAEAQAGRLPHLRAGKQILFEAATVERLLIERARKAVRHDR